jgi:hypothetical protein
MISSNYGIKNLKRILLKFPEWTKANNEGYENLTTMYGQLTTQLNRYMGHVSKNVGGVFETPKTVEQGGTIYQRTPAAKQKEAMVFLDQQLFTTPTWLLDQSILDKIGEDPISVVSRLQAPTLNRLVSNNTLSKLITAEAADGAGAYKITDFFTDMQGSVFSELKSNSAIDVYRRNLQKNYVEKLIAIVRPSAPAASSISMVGGRITVGGGAPSQSDVVSVVKGQLRELNTAIKSSTASATGLTKYHLEDLSDRIDNALKAKD